jgi:uncharacterized membrane protein YphA (DoxX/SURF4 family)
MLFTFAWWCAATVGAVFVFAGVQKILAGPDWLVQARKLGAPVWAIPSVRWVELALGCLLIADVASPVVHVATLALLVAFTALLVARLREGVRPPCSCFGSRSAKPISWWNVTRNLGLMALVLPALLVNF